jgi:hypothetical protein
MGTKEGRGSTLNIQALSQTFRSVRPLVIDPGGSSRVDPMCEGSESERIKYLAGIRARMMRSIFLRMPYYLAQTATLIEEWISEGRTPVDAVFLSAARAIQSSAEDAETADAEYYRALVELKDFHAGDSCKLTTSLKGELNWLMRHGISVLTAILEALPYVYRLHHGVWVTGAELGELMSSAPRAMLNNLTQVSGEYAVLIETALSREERRLDDGDLTFHRLVFDPRCFTLRRVNGRDVLDIRRAVCKVIKDRWVSDDQTHYGCLARLVPAVSGGGERTLTVFEYMEREIRRLLAQHWYHRLGT